VTPQPYPYRARAWWGEALVAESEACLTVDRPGEPSLLYFPRGDLDLSLFRQDGIRVSGPEGGDAETWSAESPGGDGVLSIVTATPAGLERLRDHGRFDTDRVRVEVLDGVAGTDPREVTTKQFPTWGDASHLVDMLDVHPDGDSRFVGPVRSDGRRPVVEGSQMLGQAIVAAGRLAPGRRAVSSHMVFLRGAVARQSLDFELSELSRGRTFTGLTVQVLQAGRLCAAGTVLLDVTAPGLVRHAATPPDVPGPYDCPPFDMGVTGRDMRVVDGAYTDDADAPAGPPTLDCWVRFRDLPDDPALHAGLLAQFTGHMPIAAALRPHPGVGQSQAHRTVSMGIMAIDLSLHAAVHADRWMLYHHESTFAGDGMTHAACRVHAEDGALLASFDVDAMVRPFAAVGERDGRTAL
jgi:acyl-CoA thioesterase